MADASEKRSEVVSVHPRIVAAEVKRHSPSVVRQYLRGPGPRPLATVNHDVGHGETHFVGKTTRLGFHFLADAFVDPSSSSFK